MPTPERGFAIKKGGEKVEADAMAGEFKAKTREVEELAPTAAESPEVKELKAKIKEIEHKLEIAKPAGLKKQVIKLQDRLDEAQEKLAELLSPRFAEYKKEETEKRKIKLRGAGIGVGQPSKETEAGLAEIEQIEEERIAKGEKLEKPKTELEESLAEIKKLGTVKTREEAEALKKVRGKIKDAPEKPAEEVYFSNWPGKETKPAEEKPFTKTEEAWFAEGEKAAESKEEAKKLEETAKARSKRGAPAAAYSGRAPEAITEAVRAAEEKLNTATLALQEANFDIDELTRASGFERFSIGLNIFTKRGRLLRRLYKDYVEAAANRDLELLRASSVGGQQRASILRAHDGGDKPKTHLGPGAK